MKNVEIELLVLKSGSETVVSCSILTQKYALVHEGVTLRIHKQAAEVRIGAQVVGEYVRERIATRPWLPWIGLSPDGRADHKARSLRQVAEFWAS